MVKTQTVAVLGTGTIGGALDAAGETVRIWNRTSERASAVAVGTGITVCESPQQAVTGAAVVLTVVRDAKTTLEVMRSAYQQQPGPGPSPVTWLQIGTVGRGIHQLAEWATRHGIALIDAPVQGTKQPAEQGTLVVIASGPDSARPAAERVFDVIGSRTLWVGEQPGAARMVKLALNVWIAALTHGAAESLAVARALEIDPRWVAKVISGGPLDSGFFQAKSAAILSGTYEPTFTVDNAVKDAQLVIQAVGNVVPTNLTQAARDRWQLAQVQGHGSKDMAASHLAKTSG